MVEKANPSPASVSAPLTALDRLNGFAAGPRDPAARSVWRVSQIYWAVLLYSGVWILLRGVGIGGAPFVPAVSLTLTALLAAGVLHLYIRSFFAVRRGGYGTEHGYKLGWLHTVTDLGLVAATVRVTGGIESGIWSLFFVIMVAESVLEPVREARWVRFGVASALVAATVPFPLHGGAWTLELLTRLVFLLAVSTVAQRLRQNAEREKAEIASLRAEMALIAERSHLSREIHDGVGNALAASVLRLEVAARVLDRGEDAADTPALLRDEAQTLRGAMNSVRDWTFFNKPWQMDGTIGQTPADRLSTEAERMTRRTGLPVRVVGAGAMNSLRAGAAQLAVLRIAQEALTNAAKYAVGAAEVVITLERDGGALCLSVSDDGAGFDPQAAGAGVGMASMRERAAGLGGTFSVVSAPARGTTVSVWLPDVFR